jgi:hypothetical protein
MWQKAVREDAMESTIGFAEIAGAIIGAIGLALGLEWIALNTLMRLMPKNHGQMHGEKAMRRP